MRSLKRIISEKYSIYVMPAGIAVLIILLTFFVLVPSVQDIFAKRDQITVEEENVRQLTRKRQLLQSVTEGITFSYVKEAEIALPSEKEAASILTTLENLSVVSQLTLQEIDLSPGKLSTASAIPEGGDATTRKNAKIIPVQVTARGNATQFRDFLSRIQNTRRVMDIDTLSARITPETPDILEISFSLIAYYLPPVTEIGAIDARLPEITGDEQAVLDKISHMPNLSQSLVQETGSVPVGKTDLFQ